MSRARVSFEFFPPQSLQASFQLWDAVQVLAPLAPDFVSVTYGAGGTTGSLTHDAVAAIQTNYGLNVAAHLTCVGASRAEVLAVADGFAALGVTEIVALRGDAPKGQTGFVPHPDGFADTTELVAALADRFKVRVGAYPERHPDAADTGADVAWLKRKIDAGASSAITQFFFEADTFLRFRDRCVAAGITAPIIPGILPIHNWASAREFAGRCGAHVPLRLDEAFHFAKRDGREAWLGLTQCATLCERLIGEGVQDLHFYTMNRSELTKGVVRALGLGPEMALGKVA